MARRPATSDWLVALALGVEMQVELFFIDASSSDMLVARLSLLALAAALVVRRALPVVAAAVAIFAVMAYEQLGDEVTGEAVGPFFASLFICYSLGAHAERRELFAGLAVLLAGMVIGVRLDDPPGGLDDMFFGATIIVGGPVLLGRLVRARVQLNRALREKAAAVERDRDARAAAAVADERARIAADLHHLVSDALASMVAEADAAEANARSRADVAEASFASIEETGREALGRIRTLLGVLRREDEELALAPAPSLAHLADLVARVRAGGLPVELDVQGKAPALPAGLDLTAYRVVQEALGGAQSAPGERRAQVRLRYEAGELVLQVTDAGEEPPGPERALLGVHERVQLYGGELFAGPLGGLGYEVRARLPLEHAA